MMREPYRAVLIIGAFFGLLAAYDHGAHIDADFESSDHKWWDGTMHLKGRGFNSVDYDFDEYRRHCAENTVLVRTTPINHWDIVAWPAYLLRPEWQIPFAPGVACSDKRLCRGIPWCPHGPPHPP